MTIQIVPTNKLFYRKWIYKVECVIDGAYRAKYFQNRERRTPEVNEFADALTLLLVDNKSSLQTRVEGTHFNLFCNDRSLLDQIVTKLSKWIKKVHEPINDCEKEFLLNNSHRKIIRNTLFKNLYQYRIFLKETLDADTRKNFYDWIVKYKDSKIIPSNQCKRWLLGTERYAQNPFIYVLDASMMSTICLYLGSNIKFIEECVLRDNINT